MAPRILFIQLKRFSQELGYTSKLTTSVFIKAGEILWIPVFRQGTAINRVPYRLIATCCHLGPELLAGHYVYSLSVLESDATGVYWQFHNTDDGVLPQAATPGQVLESMQNCYLCGLIRLS